MADDTNNLVRVYTTPDGKTWTGTTRVYQKGVGHWLDFSKFGEAFRRQETTPNYSRETYVSRMIAEEGLEEVIEEKQEEKPPEKIREKVKSEEYPKESKLDRLFWDSWYFGE